MRTPARACLLLLLLASCDEAERFDLEEGEAYCGQITLGGAYRQGLSPRVQMRLLWDGSALDESRSPGTLSTFDAGAEQGRRRLVDGASLRLIDPLAHDPLGKLALGDGRDDNHIFGVSAADPEAESMLAFVSLRNDDRIEVRLLRAGSPELGEVPGREPLFGLFLLSRQDHPCFE